ncbi:MAG: DUF2254 family protein [Candidatus Methanoperedens sp.]|nr:DUF2254 family protein [Candidatus Methanoperedens sp.]
MQIHNKPLWERRLVLYFSLCAVVIVISHLVFSYFNLLHTDVESARYMLSAMIQSEAAIVAIVVTLSLVVVQLAAQSYSARVIEVFRRAPDLWILIGIYGIAIFYGLGVLKLIEMANPQLNSLSNLEHEIAFSFYLGVFSYVALVPYIWKMFDMVKPSDVFEIISGKITKKNILAAIREGEEQSDESDPIQPIIDVIHASLMKYDPNTVREGLRALGGAVENIFKNEAFGKDEDEKVSKHVFSHITRIGKLVASKEDEASTIEVINNLYKCGIIATDRKFESIAKHVAISLREIGKVAAKQKLEKAVSRVAISLGGIGEAAAEQELKYTSWFIAVNLGDVGEAAAKEELADAAFMIATSLREIGEITVKLKLINAASQATESLQKLLIASKEHGLVEVSQIAELSLNQMNIALGRLE